MSSESTEDNTSTEVSALAVGDRLEHDGRAFVVTDVFDDVSDEHRYGVREESDDSPTFWLLQRPANGDAGPFEVELEGLERIHAERRFLRLPAVVAHIVDDERGELLVLDRAFGPTLADNWDSLVDPNVRSLTFEQLLLTISKIHRAGYIVGTLRPESFVTNDEGDLQLVELSSLTRRGSPLRRLEPNRYQPPEMREGLGLDERVDIYSAGAMFASAYFERSFEGPDELSALIEDERVLEPVVTQLLLGSVTERELRFLSIDEMRILLYQLKNEQARFPRPTAAISSTVGVCRYRYINEDSAGFQELTVQYQSRPQHVGFYCVADGMGGHELGERASQLAVLGSLQAFRQITQEVPFERLREGLVPFALAIGRAASEIVCSGAEQFPGGARMGTTFTGVLVLNEQLAVAHVGDSRAVLIRDGALTPLTLDHSLVASLVRVGQMTEEEAAVSDERNVLVRCIDARLPMDETGFDSLQAAGYEGGRLSVRESDRVVIVSDGVWGALPDDDILEIALRDESPQQLSDAIVGAAIRAGSDDNATALVIRWA